MTSILAPDAPLPAPRLSSPREHLVRAGASLWRVTDHRESVLGHLRVVETAQGVRYRAERLRRSSGGFVTVGAFWSPDDAVQALR